MKAFKLTDRADQTYGGCQWGEGVEHTAPGKGELCTNGWIHCTTHPLLAVLLNPIQGGYDLKTAHLWRCKATGKIKNGNGLKFGATKVKTIKRVSLPRITTEQRIRFGILCALEVYQVEHFVQWAQSWLSGEDRTRVVAWSAKATTLDAQADLAGQAACWAAEAAALADQDTWAAKDAAWAAKALSLIHI